MMGEAESFETVRALSMDRVGRGKCALVDSRLKTRNTNGKTRLFKMSRSRLISLFWSASSVFSLFRNEMKWEWMRRITKKSLRRRRRRRSPKILKSRWPTWFRRKTFSAPLSFSFFSLPTYTQYVDLFIGAIPLPFQFLFSLPRNNWLRLLSGPRDYSRLINSIICHASLLPWHQSPSECIYPGWVAGNENFWPRASMRTAEEARRQDVRGGFKFEFNLASREKAREGNPISQRASLGFFPVKGLKCVRTCQDARALYLALSRRSMRMKRGERVK